jgi:hypothetical protein
MFCYGKKGFTVNNIRRDSMETIRGIFSLDPTSGVRAALPKLWYTTQLELYGIPFNRRKDRLAEVRDALWRTLGAPNVGSDVPKIDTTRWLILVVALVCGPEPGCPRDRAGTQAGVRREDSRLWCREGGAEGRTRSE